MGEPIGEDHTQQIRREELTAAGEGELGAARQQVRRQELTAARQPEQMRSTAQERQRGAVPNPDEGSKAIGSRFARIPDHTACENTNESFVLFAIFIGENGLK